ncbi:MAG: HNH endonuclease signature motif containing protein [Cetobacterium sp.]
MSKSKPKICSYPPCTKEARANSYCPGHNRQYKLGQELTDLRGWGTVNKDRECSFDECSTKSHSDGLCHAHYYQKNIAKTKLKKVRGPKTEEWSKWSLHSTGYIYRWRWILATNKMTHEYQHRYVVEQHLGRKLLKHENVHHINGVRDDNRIENLELWSTSQPSGQRVEDKISWAMELLELYGYKINRPPKS